MNKVLLTGRLTRDPELRSLASGKSVTTFSVSVCATALVGPSRLDVRRRDRDTGAGAGARCEPKAGKATSGLINEAAGRNFHAGISTQEFPRRLTMARRHP